MGREWDSSGVTYSVATWREALRVLKPGGYLLAFGGSRTYHRLACAVEDAGFEIRDQMMWLYGSGFPKSHDVSKAIDKAAGAERAVVGSKLGQPGYSLEHDKGRAVCSGEGRSSEVECAITAPSTEAAMRWRGWGTALKPAFEPAVWAQKPLSVVTSLIAELDHALGAIVCLLSNASDVEHSSTSSQTDPRAGKCASARSAASLASLSGASDLTGTFRSPEAASIALNIASSWSAICDTLSRDGNRFTTATASSTTTALRTLSSYLSRVISLNTMPPCACLTGGRSRNAGDVGAGLSDGWRSWLLILRRSVPESAIEQTGASVAAVCASVVDSLSIEPGAGSSVPKRAITQAGDVLSPAHEPIVIARKPLSERSVAANVLKHGTGALNIDACRVATGAIAERPGEYASPLGRWPANVLLQHDEACVLVGTKKIKPAGGDIAPDSNGAGPRENTIFGEDARPRGEWAAYRGPDDMETVEDWRCTDGCPVRILDDQSGARPSSAGIRPRGTDNLVYGAHKDTPFLSYGDTGGASRFFYTAKAPVAERWFYCRSCEAAFPEIKRTLHQHGYTDADGKQTWAHTLSHPTVKPVAIMRYLLRLVTPPGGVVLDPFMGSGSTLVAAHAESIGAIGIEKELEHVVIARARLAAATDQGRLF